MNLKERNELRRRFSPDRSSIKQIFGCYVNSNREIISWLDLSLGLMGQEESEMYLSLLKKCLSGTFGKNLIDIPFSTRQVMEGEEHRLLMALRQSSLQDGAAREALCRRIIDALDMEETNYLVLLAADAYDVPYKGGDDALQAEASDTVFRYFVCCVCPVKAPGMALRYDTEDKNFHSSSTGYVAAAPELGFLFPAFDDRRANIHNALFYSRSPERLHNAVIEALFCVEPPLSASAQKEIFDAALSDSLAEDCSFDVVQSVHEQMRGRIEAHRESKDPEPLEISISEAAGILTDSGVSEEKTAAFQQTCREQYGERATLRPENIVDAGKFEVTTPEVKITVSPESSYLVETRVIDGRKYILIPAGEGVAVNGVSVHIPKE